MVRIFVEPAAAGHDLPSSFIKALNILNENGTKLVSKYAVIVTEDSSKVLEHLRLGNIAAFVER
jgi:lipopolysaccharide biosynthesis regulator YciM